MLEKNVVNTVCPKPFDLEHLIHNRQANLRLLFVGNFLYREGALKLIRVFQNLKRAEPDLSLHIIGMTQEELPIIKGLYCYGYLHKDIPKERDKYYELLTHGTCFVNPAAQWGGYSSCIEAMYYGLPVVITPYNEFVEEFGKEINFGFYCHADDLEQQILRVLHAKHYAELGRAAHNRVKDYTWSNYVDSFLKVLKSRNTWWDGYNSLRMKS